MSLIKFYTFRIVWTTSAFLIGVYVGWQATNNHHWFNDFLANPMPDSSQTKPQELPLNAWAISHLQNHAYASTSLEILDNGQVESGYTKYLFSFTTLGKTMSGQLDIPDSIDSNSNPAVVVMLRGYVPPEMYESGVGTKNAAARFAAAGYITVAPDFFGYGTSDPEPEDPWQARFEKPAIIAELLKTVEAGVPIDTNQTSIQPRSVGVWAHSNGGQIALTTLEVLRESYPTTLWAPVTAPFPYSILYFGDEVADEGKAQRAWIALFERDYDVHQFSHTQFLADLRGPLQFQQGTVDDAVPFFWTEEFLAKLDAENVRRSQDASAPARIEYSYFKYPGADHNLVGAWETAIKQDLLFFQRHL